MNNNPLRILTTLDRLLTTPVELVLFGRGAIALGFDGAPKACLATLDVDCIVESSRIPPIEEQAELWEALDSANDELRGQGLYMSHIFGEEQVVIPSDWFERRLAIRVPELRNLRLFRPSTSDLICTKMMRGPHDQEDWADLEFMLQREPLGPNELYETFSKARIPDVEEFKSAFEAMRPLVLELAERIRSAPSS